MNSSKNDIIEEIQKNVKHFKKVSSVQYRMKCPICGDSNKSDNGHLYIKCSNDPTEPLLYFCFLCNKSGRVDNVFLDRLNIKMDIPDSVYNRLYSFKNTKVEIDTGYPNPDSLQWKYITGRLGNDLTIADMENLKIIWDMSTILPYITNASVKNTLPSNTDSISFLSHDRSKLLTRFFTDTNPRWKKATIFPSENRAFYTIKTSIDLFTSDEITVNIGEGVFDVISVYKNYNTPNSVYIATLGSDYLSGMEYAIGMGFIGSNVSYRIYLDSDIDEKQLKRQLRKYKFYVDKIVMYKNAIDVDLGVPSNRIQLIEYKV